MKVRSPHWIAFLTDLDRSSTRTRIVVHEDLRGVAFALEDRPQLVTLTEHAAASIPPARDAVWLRAARQARWLAWASLVWMTVEGTAGVVAGLQADSISVLTWAASSAVEGMASVIVVWRFTSHRTLSETSERRAQRWVGASFFLLAPYFLYEAVARLINGSDTHTTSLAVALTASSVILMPALGRAKLRLGLRLDSRATSGEGMQNLLCAGQALAALVAVVGAGAGLGILDPIAAFAIAAVAAKEGAQLWRGDACGCHAVPGLVAAPSRSDCTDGCCS